ncbi:MAG: glycosyltransferase [Gammaproteobacteria bacterium]|nr:glycosyltransferase [Gammaproteobacteria bacterium]
MNSDKADLQGIPETSANGENPLISLAVFSRGRFRLLEKTLRSIAVQRYAPVEVVAVNAGGNEALAVVAHFETFPGIKIIKAGGGRANAANAALAAAAGEWIGFLNEGETLEADGLEQLAQGIPWDKDLICGHARIPRMTTKENGETAVFGDNYDADRLLLENYIPMCACIYRRTRALAAGGFDEQFELLEDWDFLLRLSRQAGVYYVPETIAGYYAWAEELEKNRERENECRTLFFQKHRDLLSPDALRRASQAVSQAAERRLLDAHAQHRQEVQALQAENEQGAALARQACERQVCEQQILTEEKDKQLNALNAQFKKRQQRIKELNKDRFRDQAAWQAHIAFLIRKMTSALPFDAGLIDLDKYGLTPFMRIYSGEEAAAHEFAASFCGVQDPLVLYKETVQWQIRWDKRTPAHMFSFKMATYSRCNRCHLELSIFSLSDAQLQAHVVIDALTLKDNSYGAFVLDRPLAAGEYRCVLHSPDADTENAVAIFVAPQDVDMEANREDGSITCLTLPKQESYEHWYHINRCDEEHLEAQRAQAQNWKDAPLISLIVPCFNSAPKWLEELLSSIHRQSYPLWECILVDDASRSAGHLRVAEQWHQKDARFRLLRHSENKGTSAASQTGAAEAKGAYLGIVDHDDRLEPQALFEVARAIREEQADVFYSDEMLITEEGRMIRCEFRPDFNYHFLLSHPYIIHLTVFRRELFFKAGGFDPELRISHDYDLLLRTAALTRSIRHIPQVLYQWRTYDRSTGHDKQEKVTACSLAALNRHLRQTGWKETEARAEKGPAYNFFRVRYKISPAKVSIIIPTRDECKLLRNCLESLQTVTKVPDGVELEFIIVDNGSVTTDTLAYLEKLKSNGCRIISKPGKFNFSQINNLAAKQASGSMLLFLNNDIEVTEADWLASMLELMAQKRTGVIGAKLIYPETGLIQHAGVIIGFNGIAGHDHHFYPETEQQTLAPGHNHALLAIRECTAVTAACMLVRRSAFEAADGFDENLHVGFGDTDLCLRLREKGYQCLFTPYARLIHHESATRGTQQDDPHPLDSDFFLKRWQGLLQKGDPFYNPNLVIEGKLFEPTI